MRRHDVDVRRAVGVFLGCLLLCVLASGVPAAKADGYHQAFHALTHDPANGVVMAKKYLASHPKLPVVNRATLYQHIANAYHDKLHDTKSALGALDTGLAEVAKLPADKSDKLTSHSRAQAILAMAKGLILSKKSPQQAVAVFDKNATALIKAGMTVRMVTVYARSLPPAQQAQKLTPIISQALQLRPQLCANVPLISQYVRYLNQLGKSDKALSYAKACWMVCPFDLKSISTATSLLSSTWMIKTISPAKGNAFMAAQKDTSKPNPLADVALPTFNTASLQARLRNIPFTNISGRVTLLLLQGKMRGAMVAARQGLLSQVSKDNSEAVLQMARVFKATDLNLVRANAFLTYFQTGKGANPLDDFFKQHPASEVKQHSAPEVKK